MLKYDKATTTYHISSHILLVLHLCQLERVLLGPEHLSTVLDSGPVWLQNSVLPHLRVLVSLPLSEAPLRRDQNLLSSRELELGTSECLDSTGLLVVLHPHGQKRPPNLHSGHCSLGLAKGTSHSSLESIGPGTAQHFVDSEHVEGVLPRILHHVLVSTDPRSLQRLPRELFQFVRDEMDTARELIDTGPLAPNIVYPDLGVRHTPAEARLGVGLVLTIPVATRRAATHTHLIYLISLSQQLGPM